MEYYRAVTNGVSTGLAVVGFGGFAIDPSQAMVSVTLIFLSLTVGVLGSKVFKDEQ